MVTIRLLADNYKAEDEAIVEASEPMSSVADSALDDAVNNDEARFAGGETVMGRVWLYDDSTKTLILKIWDASKHKYSGIGVYNSRNVQLERIHVLMDIDDDSSEFGHFPQLGCQVN